MTSAIPRQDGPIKHELNEYFPDFYRYHSTKKLERSLIYQKNLGEIKNVLASVETANYAVDGHTPRSFYRAIAWNIERGIKLEGIIEST